MLLRYIAALATLTLFAPCARADAAASFVTTQAGDTLAIEQYVRQGNTVTGDWVSNQGSTQLHHYTLTLGPDGLPTHYDMRYSVPGLAAGPGSLRSVVIDYGADSATYVTTRDSAVTARVAMRGAVPLLGKSVVGLDLALARLLAAHVDSGRIVVNLPTGPVLTPFVLPVEFQGRDSATIAGTTRARFDAAGRFVGLSSDGVETRRVRALEVDRLIAGFVAEHAAADAIHKEITLPGAALARLVGDYPRPGGAGFTVALDGDQLFLHEAGQLPVALAPESPTRFYARSTRASVEFQLDVTGNPTALVVVQGGTRRRAPREVR